MNGKWMILLGCALFVSCPVLFAQQYPVKPVRIITTFPPGGPTDLVARAIGQKFAEAWGQQFVVDHRPGAGGIIGTEAAVRAAPDGYTLLLGTSSGLSINPALIEKLPYNPWRDLAPISLLVVNPQLLFVHPSMPVRSVKDLIALAKARPGQINYASVGQGSPNHMGMEMLKAMARIDMVHIPYKGSAPAVTDIIAGHVSLMFNSMPSVLPLVSAGRLRALAVGSAKRSPAVPDIPSVAETVPGFDYVTWYGLFAPAATPRDIVTKLNAELMKMLSDPELAQRFASQGAEPRGTTPEELGRYMRSEYERWRKIIREAGIKPE